MGAFAYCYWYWFGPPSPNRTSDDWPIQPTPIKDKFSGWSIQYRSYPFEMTSQFEKTFHENFHDLINREEV